MEAIADAVARNSGRQSPSGVLHGKGHGTRRDITPPARARARRNGNARAREERHRGSTGISSSVPAGRPRSASTQDATITQNKTRQDNTPALGRASQRIHPRETAILRRFERWWRSCRPHEARFPQETPLQREGRWRRRAEHPTRHPTAFVADFDGLANVPVVPGLPGAPGGTCLVWAGQGDRRG